MLKSLGLAMGFGLGGILLAQQVVKVDPKIPQYKKVPGIAGTLNSVGSDSLNNCMTYWVEAFQDKYPGVKIQVEGKGSGTAPPALISGTSQLGPMSREMKAGEVDQFVKKYGYKPTRISVALDTLGVFVHKDNKIKSLSLKQLDGIFSKTRKSGVEDLKTWEQLGVKGAWAPKPISIYGRNSASGTYGFFKEHALENGDYKDTVKEQPGSSSVVQSVGTDKFAIGYSGIGYKTSEVRAVALSNPAKNGGKAYEANYENALNGNYPLARNLYLYVNKNPKTGLDPLVKQFVTFILSKEGQTVVIKDGYYPLPKKMIDEQIKGL